ncbi:MAG: Crp/Fnr family transcriptional regulator [Deltaproteobacteria bacterium]|nr:Crp/Fnr family transcriptional regulator [Deltaproteobacteria bacterium]MBW2053604.1 Crp/Fnr family transcriptional regulator [Deltaproteobacteria bacterium]MBW2142177.1 Crp/Fnr family transcriptional regulator [Deltaproteobacteria bacterium]MBW2323375.1 Crp/Fnr family transcriptional regulator [Deltaproteobacteria bacterium]
MKLEDKNYADLLSQVWTYEDGELIFDEGTTSGWVFVVAYGEVEIYQTVEEKKIILDYVHEGESLGELSFFDQHTRSAAARAVGKVGLMKFKDEVLMEEYENLPEYFKVLLEAMALRMRSLMRKVSLLASNPNILDLLNKESNTEK